jgi:hypothetical protein
MNKTDRKIRRAARDGVYLYRSDDGTSYDIIDTAGPRDQRLTKRAAANFAYHVSQRRPTLKMYGFSTVDNKWHRAGCEMITPKYFNPKPCDCKYLVV